MAIKVPELVAKLDVLLANLEDAIQADKKLDRLPRSTLRDVK